MATLPTGTVTFLFSDIEGSTELVKQLASRYREVLETHHRLRCPGPGDPRFGMGRWASAHHRSGC
jgi:hypothetical protein